MDIEYEITMNDLLNFNLYHLGQSSILRRFRIVVQFLVPAILIVILMLTVLTDNFSIILTFVCVVVSIFCLFLYPSYYPKHLKKATRKVCKERINKTSICRHKLSLTPNGITEISVWRKKWEHWKVIEKVRSTDDYVFIYNSAVSAYLVPRRAFHDESQYEEFMRILKQNVRNIVD